MKGYSHLKATMGQWFVEGSYKSDDDWSMVGRVTILSGKSMIFIAAVFERWDHVSVSLKDRCPHWNEMEAVRKLCFKPDEFVMQLQLPDKHHINVHPNCLHMWRPHDIAIPLPPEYLV